MWRERDYLLYHAYRRLDAKPFKPSPDAFAPRDLTTLIDDTPVLHVMPTMTKFSDRLSPGDVAAIKSHDLDVLIRLGFRILRGALADSRERSLER